MNGPLTEAIREAEALFEYSGLREVVRRQATGLAGEMLEHRIDKLPYDAVMTYVNSARGLGVWLAFNRGPVGRTMGLLFAPRWHLSLPATTRKVLLSHEMPRTLLGRALLLTADDFLASQSAASSEVDPTDFEAMHRVFEGGADAAKHRHAAYRKKVLARLGLWTVALAFAAMLAISLGLSVGVVAAVAVSILLGFAMVVRLAHPLWGDIRFQQLTAGDGRWPLG